MLIRDSRQRQRRNRSRASGVRDSASLVPHSARVRRHRTLSMRRRKRPPRIEDEVITAVELPSVLPDQPLSQLTGLTSGMENTLRGLGYTRFFQLAHWSSDDVSAVAKELGMTPQRIRELNWIAQARRRG